MRVVVVGAGITGLTAAFTLLEEDPGLDVEVLEAAARLGGKIRTSPFAGHAVDEAADAFLARVPDGIDLCERLGLADRLVAPANRSAYLFRHGALRRFPEGLVLGVPTDLGALAATGVISTAGIERAALDLTMGPEPPGAPDETVGSLVRRRLGDEIYEVLVGPLLSGVNAGDADRLSVAAGAPQLAAALRDHASLIAGARAQRAAGAGPAEAPVFYGLPGGTETLVDALADRIRAAGGRLRTGAVLTSIVPTPSGGFDLTSEMPQGPRAQRADAVVLATPLFVTARLLTPIAPDAAAAMAEVEYSSPVLITLAVPLGSIEHALDATGFLVPRSEGLTLTACSWASTKWAHLSGPDVAILRASAGRAGDDRVAGLDDPSLVDEVLADLEVTMGVRGRPVEVRVSRWDRSLPQFRPGHLERVGEWRHDLVGSAPGLHLAGAGYEGLGLPACIRQGRDAARAVLTEADRGRA